MRYGLLGSPMLASNTVPAPTIAGAGFIALDILLSNGQKWRQRAGGTCGNVLAILSFLGLETFPIARLGTDRAADLIISELESVGVNCQHLQRDPKARTPRVVEFLPDQPGSAHRFAFTCPMCQRRLPRRSKPTFEQATRSIHDLNPALFFLIGQIQPRLNWRPVPESAGRWSCLNPATTRRTVSSLRH